MNHEAEKQELINKKTNLIISKREHEVKLCAIKNLVRSEGKMPHDKYKSCCDAQNTHARALLEIEKQLGPIKNRLCQLSDIEFKAKNVGVPQQNVETKPESVPIRSIVVELVSLREQYQNFAADSTRVSSMRQMAAEFVVKLNPIIKNAIGMD